jgi:hypothetical protein
MQQCQATGLKTRYVVYRFYNAQGKLLYIGSTKSIRKRMSDHASGNILSYLTLYYKDNPALVRQTGKHRRAPRPWWVESDNGTYVTREYFISERGMRMAEMRYIATEKPYYNNRKG